MGCRLFLVAWVAVCALGEVAHAQDPVGVLELRYRPAPRAQVAVWLETATGEYVSTLRLTESVAYRGIGNRPGASQMNSGYRWPYGRREGVLPVWATRRAAQPGAALFPRVIFQNRLSEGRASRTAADFSPDDYYCLSFDRTASSQDALDAVSCASVFSSDKGRYLSESDAARAYGEPYVSPKTGTAKYASLPLGSLYPARMDLERCDSAACFDHEDVSRYAQDVRQVMPEIDAVTMATAEGGVDQSELWTIPGDFEAGDYVVMMEVAVEGDYGPAHRDEHYPTPKRPIGLWDTWATAFGYAYRGQPSVVYRVPITVGPAGTFEASTAGAHGHGSWGPWEASFGEINLGTDGLVDDPEGAPFSGVDRLRADGTGQRLSVRVELLESLVPPMIVPQPDPPPSGTPTEPDQPNSPEPPPSSDDPQPPDQETPQIPELDGPDPERVTPLDEQQAPPGESDEPPLKAVAIPDETSSSDAVILLSEGDGQGDGPVGMIRGLVVDNHASQAHGHEWVEVEFVATRASLALHRYEIRVGTSPIVDERSFLEDARPAKTATESLEGATSLKLDGQFPEGTIVSFRIGDLNASTHYYVGVRGVDRLNRAGPISVAEIDTPERTFTTVTPCFVATAAYGTPLATEIGVLRRFRDRYLLSHSLGRFAVRQYYRYGPGWADRISDSQQARKMVREVLAPLVASLRAWFAA